MNNIIHYFLMVFCVAFLSSCVAQLKKSDEKTGDTVKTHSGESGVDVVDQLNKLDQRLSKRLDSLEKLIKSNYYAVKKQAIKKSTKTTTNKTTSLSVAQHNKIIIGEAEWVYLHRLNQSLKARIDSGATTSSITASNIQAFERDGKNWVKFDVVHQGANAKATIEAPVVRTVRIKQASLDNYKRRFVVSLDISLGNSLKQKAEFSLADRSEMAFPMLLGREFLQDITLIDVGKKFLHPKYTPEVKD